MRNKSIKFSIITVVYNATDELIQTINSVRNQNFSNYEYIIIDGGSGPQTVSIIEKATDVIDAWVSETDNGIYDAMNKGVAKSKGEYLIFLNAGDQFYDTEVLSNVNLIGNEVDIIYGSCNVLGSRKNDGIRRSQSIENIPYGMVSSHQSMFFKRTTIINKHFSLEFSTAADYELICRLYSLNCSFINAKEIIVSTYLAGGVSDLNRTLSVYYRIRTCLIYDFISIKLIGYYTYQLIRAFASDCLNRLIKFD